MVLRVEFRIVLPISCEEYRIGQLYCIGKASFDETKKAKGKEGVEILENYAYEKSHFQDSNNNNYSVGDEKSKYEKRYTYKIFNMVNKMPEKLQSWFKGSNKGKMHEVCWNEFPYSKTIITNPDYMKENFECVVETIHRDMDLGEFENIHKLSDRDWENTRVVHLDLQNKYQNQYDVLDNPFIKKSEKYPDVLPLAENWKEKIKNNSNYSSSGSRGGIKFMCIYKLCSVKFKWWGLQSIMERLMVNEQEKMIRAFHRYVLCEIDNWGDMSNEDIINYEIEVQKQCDSILSSAKELDKENND